MATRRRLVERREQLGLTQADVADALGCEVGTYARTERGLSRPHPARRRRLAQVLDWTPAQVALALNDDGPAHRGEQVLESLSLFAQQEQNASRLQSWEPFVVPGLLQTAGYATAVELADPVPSDVDRLVEVRLTRQRVLDRDPPLELDVVLDESVLHRTAGNADVMAGQLDHLAAMGERPNVDLRVLRLDAGLFASAFGAFTVLTPPASADPFMVCLADRTGFHYEEARAAVDAHAQLFDHLAEVAAPPADSLDLIRTAAKEHRA